MSCRDYDCVEHAVDNGGCPNSECEWSNPVTDIIETITEAIHGLRVMAPVGALNGSDTRDIADHVLAALRTAGYEIVEKC